MLSDILRHTNTRMDQLRAQYKDQKATTNPLTLVELKAFIGVLVQPGAKKDNKLDTVEMWSAQHGGPLYRAAMSEKRFLFIIRCLRFDDRTTRPEREKQDRSAAIKDVWECFLAHCQENYIPGDKLTVDEQLLAFRGKCAFRFYIRNKPAKYGIKIIMCCDAETNYLLSAKIDLGKVRNPRIPAGQVGEYYTLQVTEPFLDCGRTVTTDNWFTGRPLSRKLWDRNTHMVGTVRKKKYIPPVMFKNDERRRVKTSIFLFDKNLMAVSYKQKKNKCVNLLSSKHNEPVIGEKNKPEVIHYYNSTKGGVDVLDRMCTVYSCSRKTNRWPLCLFYGMLNLAVINSFIMFKARGGTLERRHFMHQLAAELVMPWSRHRLQFPTVSRSIKNTISMCFKVPFLEEEEQQQRPPGKKRCALCPWSKK